MEKKRLSFIDMAKGVGIILVLFGHLIYTNEYVRVWISAFHMPVFFVLSGITLALGTKDEKDTKGRIARKARGLLIPYLWFSLIYFLVDIVNVTLNKITMHDFISNAIASVTFKGKSVLWFLVALFLSQAVLIIMQSRLNDTCVMIITVIIAAVCCICSVPFKTVYEGAADSYLITALLNIPWTLLRAGIVIPFTAAGYYACRYYDRYRNAADRVIVRAIIAVISLGLCILVAMTNWSVDTNNMILNNPLLYYAGGFMGSLSVISFCSILPDIKPLSQVGRYSLVIMAVHLDMYVLWAGLKAGLFLYGLCGISYAITIPAVIIALILGCIAAYVIERFFPFILGRRRQ